jgi:putative alpha-1,2-mannosidase
LVLATAMGWTGCSSGSGSSPDDSGNADADTVEDTDALDDIDDGEDANDGTPGLPDLLPYVDPFIGTDDSSSPHPVPGGAGGSTYPGAVVPFGMLQLGPDTPTASPSGYRYSDLVIEQFSITHFDGAGCPNNEDLPFLPVVGELTMSPGGSWLRYRADYVKATEVASPGYYRVDLDRDGVRTELTATTRTGFVRLTYPATDLARVLVQAGLNANGAFDGSLEIVAPDRIRGTFTAGGFCYSDSRFQMHFVLAFDRPFTGFGTWLGSELTPDSTTATGTRAGGYVTFDTSSNPVVQMRIGVSFVSVANAETNLAAENPGWDFDAVRAAAARRWNEVLNRIQVTGGTDEERTKFYTALYHVFQSPNVASDVTGEYLGFDRLVHTTDRIRYRNFSGWDIIRSWTHLIAALAPEGPDIINSMVQDGVEAGLLPFWSHQNTETHVMVGDPGTVNVANAYAMGVRGFDTDAALSLMRESAENPLHTQRWALENWLDVHYVSNAAVSLEYAMADFALAQFARALGDTATYEAYLARSDWWRESWNADDGYVEARIAPPLPGVDAARIYEFQVFGPADPAVNLALGGTATASASCSSSEGPEKAINGTWTGGSWDKWCDNRSAARWWQVDLGSLQSIDRFVLYHAGAGGESSAWNTQDFSIAVSTDGAAWTTVATVAGNAADTSTHPIAAVDARYVRLEITNSVQTGGGWDCRPFDPAAECGFIEGNAAQYVWMVPHNLEGLFTLMGGHTTAVTRLDDLFTELNAGTDRPYFYVGNEPEHGTPWTYNFAGAPWQTQAVVRRIVDEEFDTSPGGLPGNDDLGATSAWLVWAYLGLYPMIPGTDVLALNGPTFPSATIRLANGAELTIAASGAGAGAPYVQSLSIDGTPTTRTWLHFADVADGGTLDYSMGSSPNEAWGGAAADLPPSFPP